MLVIVLPVTNAMQLISDRPSGTAKHVETVEDLQTKECLDPVPGCSVSCSLGVNGFTSSIIEGTAKDVETVEDLQTKELLDVMPGCSSGSCLIDVNGIASSIIEVLPVQNRFDWYEVEAENDLIKIGFLTPPEEQILESPSSEADLELLRDINVDLETTKLNTMGLFGRIIEDKELYETAKERHSHMNTNGSVPTENDPWQMCNKGLENASKCLREARTHYANYLLPIKNFNTSRELFHFLTLKCTDLRQAVNCHMACTGASIGFNLTLLTLLKANGGVIDTNVYHEFSRLATTNGTVESADVPPAMEQAVNYLEMSDTVSGHKYKEFLVKHGHRCLKELDIRTETWASNPKSLIKLLQSLIGSDNNAKDEKKSISISELLTTLSIPLLESDRQCLNENLSRLHEAVQHREASKSVMVRGIDAWRKGYVRLSQLMVSEGRIPDADIMFFMTLDDINELLSTRSPKIISKAVHRRRYPVLDKYIFPEISKGFPRPINTDNSSNPEDIDDFKMEGVPVSRGIAKGFIRVALNVEEASHLKCGEILVTYRTDIGWFPYSCKSGNRAWRPDISRCCCKQGMRNS